MSEVVQSIKEMQRNKFLLMSFWLMKIHVVNNLPYRKSGIISKARVNVVKYFHLKKKSRMRPLATKRNVTI